MWPRTNEFVRRSSKALCCWISISRGSVALFETSGWVIAANARTTVPTVKGVYYEAPNKDIQALVRKYEALNFQIGPLYLLVEPSVIGEIPW